MSNRADTASSPRPRAERHRPAPQGPRTRRKWLKWVVLAVGLLVLWLARAPLLRISARPLVADEPARDCAYVWLRGDEMGLDGDDAIQTAMHLYRRRPGTEIIMVERYPSLLVREGIVESFTARTSRQLHERGVPRSAVHIIPGAARNEWEECRLVGAWLQSRPRGTVVVLSDRLASGALKHVVCAACAPQAARRMKVYALRGRWGDETNWWQSRSGAKDWMFGWLGLIHVCCFGEPSPPQTCFDPDRYEQLLRRRLSDATP